jgi:uncharacterized protein YdhG (YjbR/CyaY superfamily)
MVGRMQSDAANVDDYLREVPEERVDALTQLRGDCRKLLDGFEESMQYGMPTYAKDGEAQFAFASQRQYIAVYVMRHDVLNQHRDKLAGLNVGKSCIRYRKSEQIDHELLRTMLKETAASA